MGERILILFQLVCSWKNLRLFVKTVHVNWLHLKVFAGALGLIFVPMCYCTSYLWPLSLLSMFGVFLYSSFTQGRCSPNAGWSEILLAG